MKRSLADSPKKRACHKTFPSNAFLIAVFQKLNDLIKPQRDRTQDQDGCDQHIELEEMGSGSDRKGYTGQYHESGNEKDAGDV